MSFRRMRHVKAREFQSCDCAWDFSNPANLYDATSGGSLVAADGAIARADDVSGGSAHMTQGTSGSRPLRKVAALNGMDVARFDGSDDQMAAGDVGDMRTSPVEIFIVIKHAASAAVKAMGGKDTNNTSAGRFDFSIYQNKDRFLSLSAASVVNTAEAAESTALQVLHGVVPRTAGTNANITKLRRNGAQIGASTGTTDPGNDLNTSASFQLGTPGGATFGSADVGEMAKYSTLFSDAQRRRLELSRCRKWRIAS